MFVLALSLKTSQEHIIYNYIYLLYQRHRYGMMYTTGYKLPS